MSEIASSTGDGAKDDHIRAAERTLLILSAMNRRPVSSIDHLHDVTGLPKPTLVRFLKTLTNLGYVSHSADHLGYQLTSLVTSLSAGYHGDPLIVEAGRAWAIQITRELKWPVSIAVLSGSSVIVRLSTVASSPISPFHATINMRLGLFSRALGKSYVAFCSDGQIENFADDIDRNSPDERRYVADRGAMWSQIEMVRQKGYAMRDARAQPNNSNTVAVPIFLDGQVRATLGLTFFRSSVRSQRSIEEFANRLKEASQQIERETVRLIASGTGRVLSD